MNNRIIGLVTFNGDLVVATEKFIFTISKDKEVIFSVDAADALTDGKNYVMVEQKGSSDA